jgi:hypothetical protein
MIAPVIAASSDSFWKGQVDLLQDKPVHVAVHHRDRMSCRVDGKATSPEATDAGVQQSQRCRTRRRPRRHQGDRPGVSAQDCSRVARSLTYRWPPSIGARGELDLGRDHVDQPVQDLGLPADVVIERGSLDPELTRTSAHGDRLETLTIRHRDRALECPVPIDRRPTRDLASLRM